MSDADEEEYVDDAQVRLDDQEGPSMDPIDFGDEHVQWALNTELPSNISGVDTSQRPDGGQYVV